MSNPFVVIKGSSDQEILAQLLPSALVDSIRFIAGGDRSNMMSLARTLAASKRLPVALVYDLGWGRDREAFGDIALARTLLRDAAFDQPVDVFAFDPEIEIVFFEDMSILERITGKTLPEETIETARTSPKQTLKRLLDQSEMTFPEFLERLSLDETKQIREHPILHQLELFLSQVIAPVNLA